MKTPLLIVIVSFIFILSCNKGKESLPDTEKSEQTKSEAVQKETTPQAEKEEKKKASEAVEAVKEETTKAADELKEETTKVVQAEAEKEASQAVEPGKEETKKAAEDVKEEVVKEVSGPEGAQLFQSKGCAGCHRPDNDVVGPSLKTIAKVYKEKNGNLIKFLKGEDKAIVDPKKAAMMKPLLNPIKSLSDEELKALADYMLQ